MSTVFNSNWRARYWNAAQISMNFKTKLTQVLEEGFQFSCRDKSRTRDLLILRNSTRAEVKVGERPMVFGGNLRG
ncbi:MFS transporter asaE [Fusarium oxysporum f. sp. albedinis]|nr:MFS transporter asaE [Fusarium oxysporum f. sp. albedinis]